MTTPKLDEARLRELIDGRDDHHLLDPHSVECYEATVGDLRMVLDSLSAERERADRAGYILVPDNTEGLIANGLVGVLDCLDEIASAEWSGDDAVERIKAFARREHDYALAALSKPNAPGNNK